MLLAEVLVRSSEKVMIRAAVAEWVCIVDAII